MNPVVTTDADNEVNGGPDPNTGVFAQKKGDTRFGKSNNDYQTSQSGGSTEQQRSDAGSGRLSVRTEYRLALRVWQGWSCRRLL